MSSICLFLLLLPLLEETDPNNIAKTDVKETRLGLRPLTSRGHLCGCGIPPACGLPHQGCGFCLDCVIWQAGDSSHLSQCGLFFTSLVVENLLLVFRLFSEIVVLYVVVALACLWEEVSSGSSYSTMLIWTSLQVLISLCTFKKIVNLLY